MDSSSVDGSWHSDNLLNLLVYYALLCLFHNLWCQWTSRSSRGPSRKILDLAVYCTNCSSLSTIWTFLASLFCYLCTNPRLDTGNRVMMAHLACEIAATLINNCDWLRKSRARDAPRVLGRLCWRAPLRREPSWLAPCHLSICVAGWWSCPDPRGCSSARRPTSGESYCNHNPSWLIIYLDHK